MNTTRHCQLYRSLRFMIVILIWCQRCQDSVKVARFPKNNLVKTGGEGCGGSCSFPTTSLLICCKYFHSWCKGKEAPLLYMLGQCDHLGWWDCTKRRDLPWIRINVLLPGLRGLWLVPRSPRECVRVLSYMNVHLCVQAWLRSFFTCACNLAQGAASSLNPVTELIDPRVVFDISEFESSGLPALCADDTAPAWEGQAAPVLQFITYLWACRWPDYKALADLSLRSRGVTVMSEPHCIRSV